MPAIIKGSEIKWAEPVKIRFGFSGIEEQYAIPIMRRVIAANWTNQRRPKQCVYIVRLAGEIAINYLRGYSPVIYVGEGNAFWRTHQHAAWLAPLACSIAGIGIDIHVAAIARKNKGDLYKHVEADFLRFFSNEYGTTPWFNRQHEPSREGRYGYSSEAAKEITQRLSIGKGHKYRWAIQPTPNNPQHEAYAKGRVG